MSMETVSFATAARGVSPDALRYAHNALRRGSGWQNAAKMSGIPVEDLKQHLLPGPVRQSYAPASRAIKREPVAPAQPPAPAMSPQTRAVIAAVAKRFGISVSDLLGCCQRRRIAWPRQYAYAMVQGERGLSLPEIGRIFSGRDHTTVLYGINKHQQRVAWCEVLLAFADFSEQPDLFAAVA